MCPQGNLGTGAAWLSSNVPAKLSAHVLADISASVGLAVYPINGNGVEELIAYADKAMYEEKARMKNSSI